MRFNAFNTSTLSAFLLALTCFALLPKAQALRPAPGGGYPGGNTAEGQNALSSLTTGLYNTALGFSSLTGNTEGKFNTATGVATLLLNTADQNTADGAAALWSNSTGASNTAAGSLAVFRNTTGNDNIDIGNDGVAAESGTIRIGDPAVHQAIFLAGITPMTPSAPIQALL